MALDFLKKIFKNKKIKEKTIHKENEEVDKKIEGEAVEGKKEISTFPEVSKIKDVIFHLIKPHLTEKSSSFIGENKYVFWVNNDSNKIEIKKAIENLYKVNVINVNTINPKPKKIRLGRISGIRPVYKKAIVTLAEGQKIEVI